MGTSRQFENQSELSNFMKGACGFAVGAAASVVVAIAALWLASLIWGDYAMPHSASALGIVPLMSGVATAKLFQRQNFLHHFDRLTFGMKRRFPLAVYGAWALLWVGYLVSSKDDFGLWYGDHTRKIWLMVTIPPTAILAAIILIRWAHAPTKDDTEPLC